MYNYIYNFLLIFNRKEVRMTEIALNEVSLIAGLPAF